MPGRDYDFCVAASPKKNAINTFVSINSDPLDDKHILRFTLTSCDMAPLEICGWLSISVAAYLARFSAFGYSKNAIALATRLS